MANLLPEMSNHSKPTQSELDLRLSRLQAEYLSLCRTRNKHYAATSKLPPEILADIFEFVRSDSRFYAWMPSVTHICSAWRDVALSTPALWSSGALKPPEWGLEVLRRAQGATLDLYFPSLSYTNQYAEDHPERQLIRQALKNPDQIHGLVLPIDSLDPDDVIQLFSSLVGSSLMPQLEMMSITSTVVRCNIPDSMWSSPGTMPRIRVLVLTNCFVRLDTPRFGNVRTLLISGPGNQESLGPYTKTMILNGLRAMPHLEFIDIRDAIPADIIETLPSERFVLPKLYHAAITASSSIPLSIFKYIDAPKVTRVDIDITGHELFDFSVNTTTDDLQSIYSFISFDPTSPDAVHELVISRNEEGSSFSMTHSQHDWDWRSFKELHLRRFYMEPGDAWQAIPHEYICTLSLRLTIDDLPPPPASLNIISSLATSTNIKHIHVPFLYFADEGHLTQWKSSPAFPNLEEVILECMGRKPKNQTFLQMRAWLVARKQQGLTPLVSVDVYECPHHKASILEVLKTLVSKRFLIADCSYQPA
ncbi:hypothetical protein ONZ45_g3627 [Pleurotus djamor]|nr:hypothetical protein ONZ45_g3627 [Pleurotus djamor]